ncbi:MAG: MFS transporter [Bacillota bacterium]|nr:MFS transporter [Bacillota bacterium]
MEKLHKGWVMLVFVMLTVIACLGFGRFSFGAILPFMKAGLAFDYRQAGAIGSSIFLGYLISVTLVGYVVIRFGAKKVIVLSLLLTAAGMFLTGRAPGFGIAYLGCLIMGLGTGGANLPAMGLISRWFAPVKKGMAMGIAMSGSGFGIVFSGFVVPRLVALGQEDGWRTSWFVLATLVVVVAVINLLFLKSSPEQLGLLPVGQAVSLEQVPEKPIAAKKTSQHSIYKNPLIWRMGFIYFLWGFSYLVFSTFLVDYLINDLSFANELAGKLFAIVGFASILSGFIWGAISDRLGRFLVLAVVFCVQASMLAALSFTKNPGIIALEIAVYGITLWGVPAIMTASIADVTETKYFTVAIGFVTIFFSVGQFISPYLTGFIIESTGKYLVAFLVSAGLSLVGGFSALLLHATRRRAVKASNDS